MSHADLVATPLMRGLMYPECPRWHGDSLWFSDQHAGVVHRIDATGRSLLTLTVPGQPSGLGWLPNGSLLIVSMLEHRVYRWNGRELIVHADLASVHPFHSNDMVVSVDGDCYVGNIGFDFYAGAAPQTTVIARVDMNGRVQVAADDLLCPNGTVISADGSRLIVAESLAHRLTEFRRLADGTLRERREFAVLGDHVPDGICLDAEGCVWAASPFSQSVIRVRDGGEIIDRVRIADGNPYACVLGGPERKDLYICVATDHMPEVTRARRGGRIDVARVAVPGAGLP
jgi:sugar lactone lactonase YvrE